MSEKLKIYTETVKSLAENKSNFIFPNTDARHAAIVLESMVRHSEKEFRLFDDNLSGDISDNSPDFIEAIEKSVTDENDKVLKFVIADDSHKDTRIYQKLAELSKKFPYKVLVKKASDQFISKMEQVTKEAKLGEIKIIGFKEGDLPQRVNFAVGDRTSFRLEYSVKDKRSAFCSFNNEFFPNILVDAFESQFNNCTPVFSKDFLTACSAV